MKYTLFIPAAALLLLAACTENSSNLVDVGDPLAAGGSPHFIANATSCTQVGNNLVCTFKEAGLESGSIETVSVTVSADADYGCVNGGGTVPSDPKKSIEGNLTSSGEFPAAKNGNIVGSVTVSPIPANQALSCPPGQTATLISITYFSPALIKDEDSGASISITSFD